MINVSGNISIKIEFISLSYLNILLFDLLKDIILHIEGNSSFFMKNGSKKFTTYVGKKPDFEK
jgi:hypothetical protein